MMKAWAIQVTIKFHQLLVIGRCLLFFIVQVICMVPIGGVVRFFLRILCLSDEVAESGRTLAAQLKVWQHLHLLIVKVVHCRRRREISRVLDQLTVYVRYEEFRTISGLAYCGSRLAAIKSATLYSSIRK